MSMACLNGMPPDLDERHSLGTTEVFPYTGTFAE
jgi:hypothetical protein